MSLASQRLHTGVEGVVPIVYTVLTATSRRNKHTPALRDLLWRLLAHCRCDRCTRGDGRSVLWPSHYVGSVGRSFECYLERNSLYSGGHYPQVRGAGTTTSPSAAAIAALELRGYRLARPTLKRDKHDEAAAARARAKAKRQGWVRLKSGKWEKRGGELSGGADTNSAGSKPNC